MKITTLRIKNMVCPRCIRVVGEELTKIGLPIVSIELGVVTIGPGGEPLALEAVERVLRESGFELIQDREQQVTERIKILVLKLVHYHEPPHMPNNYSRFIAEQIGRDYAYLSQVFSSQAGVTLEKYIILQKTERAKELLSYGQLPIGRIARQLGYRSLSHFSNQFKCQTGHTPSEYKRLAHPGRKGLDRVSEP